MSGERAQTGDRIKHRIRVRTVRYGDRRKFAEYCILFCQGRQIVGAEDGPRRKTKTRKDAMRAARARIAQLKTHRLFAIRVTRKHIRDGEERNCDTCAISQALFHNQQRMGLDNLKCSFRVEPYGWSSRGIVLQTDRYATAPDMVLEEMPDMISYWQSSQRNPYPESMLEWTMLWDDWAQARHETPAEYRERTGNHDGKPSRPGPTSFVLDLDAFKPESSP